MSEEEAMLWQDALEEILAERPGNASCPFCGASPLKIETQNGRTKVSCPQCTKYIEGKFGGAI